MDAASLARPSHSSLTEHSFSSSIPFMQSWHETNMVLLLGRSVHPPIRIEPEVGVKEAEALETLDRIKAERVSRFLWDAKTVGLKVKKVYSKTSAKSKCIRLYDSGTSCRVFDLLVIAHRNSDYSIVTEEKEGWFAGSLTYVHMALMCKFLRNARTCFKVPKDLTPLRLSPLKKTCATIFVFGATLSIGKATTPTSSPSLVCCLDLHGSFYQ